MIMDNTNDNKTLKKTETSSLQQRWFERPKTHELFSDYPNNEVKSFTYSPYIKRIS